LHGQLTSAMSPCRDPESQESGDFSSIPLEGAVIASLKLNPEQSQLVRDQAKSLLDSKD
ncbi:hypothetical protein LINPERHAP1_LOCUS3180, partial [Linum perenne]